MGYVDQSSTTVSQVNHDQTYNRTHDGDNLIPESLDAGSVSATDYMTVPIYQSTADVPDNISEGQVVFVKDDNSLYVEGGG